MQILGLMLAATILLRTADVDAKTGEAILDPVIAASVRVSQISGPTAAKGEILSCELVNHPAEATPAPDSQTPATVQPAWSELKCKNGARYKIGSIRFQVAQ